MNSILEMYRNPALLARAADLCEREVRAVPKDEDKRKRPFFIPAVLKRFPGHGAALALSYHPRHPESFLTALERELAETVREYATLAEGVFHNLLGSGHIERVSARGDLLVKNGEHRKADWGEATRLNHKFRRMGFEMLGLDDVGHLLGRKISVVRVFVVRLEFLNQYPPCQCVWRWGSKPYTPQEFKRLHRLA